MALETLRGNSLQPADLELEWVQMVKGIEEEKRIAKTVGPLDIFRGEQETGLVRGCLATQLTVRPRLKPPSDTALLWDDG